jgi:hypothetical protein
MHINISVCTIKFVICSGAYIYGVISIMKLTKNITMKENLANRVTLLLSFFIIVTTGKGISYKNQRQNNAHMVPYRQVNKTIQV